MGDSAAWLGMAKAETGTWLLPVAPRVLAGSSALFGGCGTAAAIVAARSVTDHPTQWLATHFFGLAKSGSEVVLRPDVVAAGRTIAHVSVKAEAEGRPCFVTRLACGERPAIAEAVFTEWPSVPSADRCEPFDLSVHHGTFAEGFEWRLCPPSEDGTSRWWVRATAPGLDRCAAAAVLCDYVTYGIGRAAGVLVGGLSIDNVVRFRSPASAVDGWLLLDVRAESLDGGFGSGTARIWTEEGTLVATGSQTMVLNAWDWRTAEERERDG